MENGRKSAHSSCLNIEFYSLSSKYKIVDAINHIVLYKAPSKRPTPAVCYCIE